MKEKGLFEDGLSVIKSETVKSGWSIMYIERSQVIASKTYCYSISFPEDRLFLSRQCRT